MPEVGVGIETAYFEGPFWQIPTSIFALITLLMVITSTFEGGKDFLMHIATKYTKPNNTRLPGFFIYLYFANEAAQYIVTVSKSCLFATDQ